MTAGTQRLPKKELDLVLWLGILAGPFAWALQQQVSYMLTPSVCEAGQQWWLHLVSLAALLVALAGGLLAWTTLRRFGTGPIDQGEMRNTRARFMAVSGMGLSAFFAVVVVATEVPNWFLGACA